MPISETVQGPRKKGSRRGDCGTKTWNLVDEAMPSQGRLFDTAPAEDHPKSLQDAFLRKCSTTGQSRAFKWVLIPLRARWPRQAECQKRERVEDQLGRRKRPTSDTQTGLGLTKCTDTTENVGAYGFFICMRVQHMGLWSGVNGLPSFVKTKNG